MHCETEPEFMFKSSFNRYLLILFMTLFAGISYASFNKSLWPRWEVNNPLSSKVLSHQKWQDFLNQYVMTNEEDINLVDYARISPKDLSLLKRIYQRDVPNRY